jgi:metallo-beta-lactamase family protein
MLYVMNNKASRCTGFMPSSRMISILPRDAGFLNEKDAEWDNRKRERKGLPPVAPLYTQHDAQTAMKKFKGLAYGRKQEILPGITLRLADAGHILGSSIIELWISAAGRCCKLVFSGDLGHRGAPILRDPAVISEAGLVLMESTYGDRLHRSRAATEQEMNDIMTQAAAGNGNILIPAFAIGRTQELLYILGRHSDDWQLQRWQVFPDWRTGMVIFPDVRRCCWCTASRLRVPLWLPDYSVTATTKYRWRGWASASI